VSHAHDAGDRVDDIRRRVGHQDVRTTRRLLPTAEDDPGRAADSTSNTPTDPRR